MTAAVKPARAAVIGGGVIGGGWVARLIQNGVDVGIYDSDPEASRKIDAVMTNADAALGNLTMAPLPRRGEMRFAGSVAEAVAGAELIVEAVPERLDIKQAVYAEIEAAAAPDALISSSTSGILPSDLQAKMDRPERLLVGHPFNPVYLLPLVELVGGKSTSAETIERAAGFFAGIGMHPLRIRKEIEAADVEAVIPAKVNRLYPAPHDRAKYKWRHLIERLFNRLKNWCRVATRYDKTAASYLGFIHIAAARLWMRVCQNDLAFCKMVRARPQLQPVSKQGCRPWHIECVRHCKPKRTRFQANSMKRVRYDLVSDSCLDRVDIPGPVLKTKLLFDTRLAIRNGSQDLS